MRKSVWMIQLERALSREGMTGAEKRTVMNFYEEMYQDKLDDGLSEEEIIKEFGFPEDVAQNVRETEEQRESDKPKKKSDCANNEDFEAEGYEIHPAKLYRPAPEYNQRPYANTAPPQAPVNQAPTKANGASVAQTVFMIFLDIVLYSLGLGLTIGGFAVIVSSFVVITFNIGAWLFTLGIGIILFACGCLSFGSAIKVTKSLCKATGGAK